MRQLRRERDWSQEQLAWEVPCDRTSIGRIERGVVSPTLDMMWKISAAFGISFAQLAALIEEPCNRGNSNRRH